MENKISGAGPQWKHINETLYIKWNGDPVSPVHLLVELIWLSIQMDHTHPLSFSKSHEFTPIRIDWRIVSTITFLKIQSRGSGDLISLKFYTEEGLTEIFRSPFPLIGGVPGEPHSMGLIGCAPLRHEVGSISCTYACVCNYDAYPTNVCFVTCNNG